MMYSLRSTKDVSNLDVLDVSRHDLVDRCIQIWLKLRHRLFDGGSSDLLKVTHFSFGSWNSP